MLKKIAQHLRNNRPVSSGKRSVVFYQHCYYHHYYLAKALARRGWDAISVSLEDPASPNYHFYHGEDVNLYDADPEKFQRNVAEFYRESLERFDLMHFAGDGHLSFFPENYTHPNPPDILRWKSLGKKIAYTTSGCNSGIMQESIREWAAKDGRDPICDNCTYQSNELVCSTHRNLSWGLRAERHCDLIFADNAPALDLLQSYKTIRDPVSSAMDPAVWHPNLRIPEKFRISREPGELLIYHSFGNYSERIADARNPKGTPYVAAAVERLKKEGHKLKFIFVSGVTNLEARYTQAQADIVVDQLHFGRYGATAKECMMLGKPVICYINLHEMSPEFVIPCMKELPLVSAGPETLYFTLKDLISNPAVRREIGAQGSKYMLKWHSADECAKRYEQIYDRMMSSEMHAFALEKLNQK